MPSLYRKWRSGSFDDLYGQDHVVRTLRNAVRQHRIAHAYLFTGPRGTGKTSTARILAKAVNCLNPHDGNPCNECEMCVAANEGRALDVIEIDAASNTSVENVRDLRDRVAYAAGEGRWKVYIIDEVHRLSAAAFDAFLKTLEEPPAHVIFVFASTEPHKVPATIMSRCQRFDFRRIATSVALERLRFVAEAERMEVDDGALQLIAQNADGSLRDALGLLDQVVSYTEGRIAEADVRTALGLADPGLVGRLTDALLESSLGAGLGEFSEFVAAGGDPGQLTRQFVEYWRALLLCSSGMAARQIDVDPALAEKLPAHAGKLTDSQITAVLRAMTRQEFSSKFTVPTELPFEIGYTESVAALRAGQGPRAEISKRPDDASMEVRASPAITPQRPARDIPAPNSAPREMRDSSPSTEAAAAVHGAEPPQNGIQDTSGTASPMGRPNDPSVPEGDTTVGRADQQPATSATPPSDVESAWPSVVAAMRARSPSLQAMLRSGYLLKVENGEITLGFQYSFHLTQFTDIRKRRILEEVVRDVTGAAYRVTCVQTTKEEIEALRGPGAVEEDDGFIEEVAERLRDFHARQIGNSAS